MSMLYGITISKERWRLTMLMASFQLAKRIQKVATHGKVDQARSTHINTTMLRGSQFHRKTLHVQLIICVRYVWMPSVMDHDHIEPRMSNKSPISRISITLLN